MRWLAAPARSPRECSAVDEGPLGAAATARLLERHDLRPRKALGQHFLIDPNTTRRIVDAAGVGAGDRVVEVGAGVGTLTRALAATGARVVAYEVDERLRPLLMDTLDGLEVDLRFGCSTDFRPRPRPDQANHLRELLDGPSRQARQ